MTRTHIATERDYDRRTVLKAGIAAATTAAVGTGTAAASGRDSAAASLKDWLWNVGNFDGIVDERGNSEVTIDVGAEGNNGSFAFGPAAVRVDPGTTVVWKWTGGGGSHNVVAKDGSYESKMKGSSGATFEQTFEKAGVSPYYCGPHKAMGMKGAVIVGDVEVEVPSTDGDSAAGGGSSDDDSSGDGESADGGSGVDVDYGGWFDDVGNFDGTVDATGQDEVTIEVGSQANNGAFGFGPAAVQVDPGTTVVWEWTGKGGSHNVVAKDGSYESNLMGDSGATFERTFDEAGVSKYYCAPHKAMGMKGAVVVGDGEAAGGASGGESGGGSTESGSDLWVIGLVGGLVSALLSPFLFGAFLYAKDDAGTGEQGRQRSQHP